MKKTLYRLLCLTALFAAASCTDDFPIGDYEIGDGEAMVTAEVNFHPLVATDVNTGGRADGNALSALEDITVFVYDEQSMLYTIFKDDDLKDLKVIQKDKPGANEEMPGYAGDKAEETTATASFTLGRLPYGRYYIYVTANIPSFGGVTEKSELMKKFSRLEELKKYTVEWNAADISKNAQMFGYFTENGEDDGLDAYQVTINKKMVNLHAWVKRCASKVTVVFDGKGLKEDVWVYVQNVRIKSIPKYCHLGEENSVSTEKGGGKYGEGGDSLITNGDVLYYNAAGVTTTNPGDDYTKWLQISKGSGLKGAVSIDKETKQEVTHSEYDQALYFYENMQGDFTDSPDKAKYDKKQVKDSVGTVPKPGYDNDYKDNVPFGTYIEVEAYYVSQNPENISNGRIIYRFMLGQDCDYNYNAIRNHHYKLTLGFKGWANQPDWHIVYMEPEHTIYTNPTYYVSYSYNTKSYFPIRLVGNPVGLEVEIVENNWAPYDPETSDHVPTEIINSGIQGEPNFEWNRTAYFTQPVKMKEGNIDITEPSPNYALQRPYNSEGTTQIDYSAKQQEMGAPDKVTAIWAGFLALQVPDKLETYLMPNKDGYTYYKHDERVAFKNYYYNKTPDSKTPKPGYQQNFRKFDEADLTFGKNEKTKEIGSGNNLCVITKADDGSITVNLPMWTRPKTMLGISGFSGNNPYDTYQRKAMVRVTAKYRVNGQIKTITRYRPVYQVERVVNPKAVWRPYGDSSPFHVKLMRRKGAASTEFSAFESEGAWRAKVKTSSEAFITLSGGNLPQSDGYVHGATGTQVDFTINFSSTGRPEHSLCAIIEVEYHGYTCKHSIYVRQGYNEPLQIAPGGKKWSSYSLFKTKKATEFGTQWNGNKKNYIEAELTANPLSLGTLFRRGNYNGILVWNNNRKGLGANDLPGNNTFKMSDSDISKLDDSNDGVWLAWYQIQGYPYSKGYTGSNTIGGVNSTYTWGRFKVQIGNEPRHYKVPSLQDYEDLIKEGNGCEFGIGVLYGAGSTETATKVSDAYGFLDVDNNGTDDNTHASNVGMRGILVYNSNTANQVFFPIGFRGMGRRTMTGYKEDSFGSFGVLRYGALTTTLTGNYNKFRPIPFNMPAAPGAIYWIDKMDGDYMGWDMNYFDLNFNAYDYGVGRNSPYKGFEKIPEDDRATWGYTHGGDALPIKLVLDESN